MDSIIIERIWEDDEFFEVKFSANSNVICAQVKSYTTKKSISNLIAGLESFIIKQDDRFFWENGEKGDLSTPYISLEAWNEDKCGHIIIEVYMELEDGAAYGKHNCCFYVKSELGLLNQFGKALHKLNEPGIGAKAVLNEVW